MESFDTFLKLFGYFDLTILGFLLFFNIKNYGKVNGNLGCWIGVILFGLVLPFISMMIELQIVKSNGGWMDSFEVAYVFLRFPTYWIIGIVQSIFFALTTNKKDEPNR